MSRLMSDRMRREYAAATSINFMFAVDFHKGEHYVRTYAFPWAVLDVAATFRAMGADKIVISGTDAATTMWVWYRSAKRRQNYARGFRS